MWSIADSPTLKEHSNYNSSIRVINGILVGAVFGIKVNHMELTRVFVSIYSVFRPFVVKPTEMKVEVIQLELFILKIGHIRQFVTGLCRE